MQLFYDMLVAVSTRGTDNHDFQTWIGIGLHEVSLSQMVTTWRLPPV